jgi:hypothetical protein
MSVLAKDMTPRWTACRVAPPHQRHLRQHRHAVERGWVYGSLMYGDSAGAQRLHLLLGMLKTKRLRNALFAISRQFEQDQAR